MYRSVWKRTEWGDLHYLTLRVTVTAPHNTDQQGASGIRVRNWNMDWVQRLETDP